VLGFGHIGRRHVQEILAHPNCELSAIVESNADHFNSAQESYGKLVQVFHSFSDFIDASVHTDVVSICLPNGLHAKYAAICLKHGFDVLVEKPFCLTTMEGKDLIQLAELFNRKIFVVKQNRFSPSVLWMKSLIDTKKMGKIHMVQINCFWNRDARYYTKGSWRGTKLMDGGPLYTQFSHFIDIMYWLFGDINDINASFHRFNLNSLSEFEDSGIIHFKFLNEGVGTFQYSTAIWNTNFESSITVIGELGTVKIGGQYMNKVDYCHIQDYTMPIIDDNVLPNNYGDYLGSASNHFHIYNNVVRCLNGVEQIAIDAQDGLKVVEIIEKILESNKNLKQ
jgi:UDP-N-acetyl-2-amino-2-deoxyglucuronate dehydrogenase